MEVLQAEQSRLDLARLQSNSLTQSTGPHELWHRVLTLQGPCYSLFNFEHTKNEFNDIAVGRMRAVHLRRLLVLTGYAYMNGCS